MATNFGRQFAINGFVSYNFGCMIASETLFDSRGWVFGVKLSDEDIPEIECVTVVAMATNFGTKIAISWLCVNDRDYAVGYEGGLSGRRQNADIAECRYPSPKGRSMATTFWLSVDYNFGCMIASNTLFDSRSGFSGSNYPIKT